MKPIVALSFMVFLISPLPAQQKPVSDFNQAMPEEGWEAFKAKIRFPELARRVQVEAGVFAIVMIDSTGSLEDSVRFYETSGLYKSCVQEVILSTKWIPATKNGKPVRSNLTITIFFTMRDLQNHQRIIIDTTRARYAHEPD